MSQKLQPPFFNKKELRAAAEMVKQHIPIFPKIAVVLGSGLGHCAETLTDKKAIPSHAIPGYPASTVHGHKGRWVAGLCEQTPVLAVQGRVHGYEGLAHAKVAFPIHLMAEAGVRTLIITNAAGGINRFYRPGDLMVIADQINLMFQNPLRGLNDPASGPRFPDMSEPFTSELIDLAMHEGVAHGLRIHRGVYLGVNGPSYETAAEIRMAERIGADAVGMSTVPEVIAAAYRRLRVLGISCITNMATGMSAEKLRHADVIRIAEAIKGDFTRLLIAILQKIAKNEYE